jgi:hypothetical protein
VSSYIAFDLDALNVARDVGAAAGIPEERVTHGLLRMWAWCFREKTEHVTATHVRGFFGADAVTSLMAFGFLATAADGFDLAPEAAFRVRGAERYLRISEARKRGADKTNSAKRERAVSVAPAAVERRSSDAQATLKSVNERALNDALTPSTEHRAPNTIEELAPASRSPRDSDLMCADFEEVIGEAYEWQGVKDGAAFAALRKTHTLEEIRSRWRSGLKSNDKWLGVRTVAQLRSKWNDLAKMPLDLTGDWRSRVDHSKDFFGEPHAQ